MSHNLIAKVPRILIVEDEYFIAQDIAYVLESGGATVLGPVSDETGAYEMLYTATPDCVLLDINLGERSSFAFAAALNALSIPFIFMTGYTADSLPEQFRDVALLQKPFNRDQVMASIGLMLDGHRDALHAS